MRTGIVTHPLYLEHDAGPGHPENPKRLRAILERLDKEKLAGKLIHIEPRPASRAEVEYIHTSRHFDVVASTAGRHMTYLDGDTGTSERSFEAALLAAGAAINLADALASGKIDNGFALVRPPGHHAEPDAAMGFCLFNNVAIAAEYGVRNLGLKRVLIVDWDLHHGNGTQAAFYDRKDVLYFSTHQFPHYPGTGSFVEVGEVEGEGFTVNVPLPAGCGDENYLCVINMLLKPIADEFEPDLVLVSAGFDTHENDPLGGMRVTASGFRRMTSALMRIASEHCRDRIGLVLEGGYDLDGLSESCQAVFEELLSEERMRAEADCGEKFLEYLDAARKRYSKYWKSLEKGGQEK